MRFMMWPFGTPRRPSQEKDYLIGTSCGSMSVADGACCLPPSGGGCVPSRAAFRASTSPPEFERCSTRAARGFPGFSLP